MGAGPRRRSTVVTASAGVVPDLDDFTARWEAWHGRHEARRADPHGFLAITGRHWLDGEPRRVPDAPGGRAAGPGGGGGGSRGGSPTRRGSGRPGRTASSSP